MRARSCSRSCWSTAARLPRASASRPQPWSRPRRASYSRVGRSRPRRRPRRRAARRRRRADASPLAQSAGVRGESSLGPRAADGVQRQGRGPDASFEAQHESCSVRIAGFSLCAGPRIDPCASRAPRAPHPLRLPPPHRRRPPLRHAGRLHPLQAEAPLPRTELTASASIPSPSSNASARSSLAPASTSSPAPASSPPASPRRRAIIPAPTPRRRRPTIPPTCAKSAREQTSEGEKAPRKKPRSRARTNPYIRWSELLRRSFGIDISTCPHCNGRRRILAFLDDPTVVHKILDQMRAAGMLK